MTPELLALQQVAAEPDKAESAVEGSAPASEPRGHGAKYPRKWHQAVTALLKFRSISEAARSIGMARSTLCRWLALPAFGALLGKELRTFLDAVTRILLRAYSNAVADVHNLCADPSIPEAVRLDAGIFRLDVAMTLEKEDLRTRLAALDQTGNSGADRLRRFLGTARGDERPVKCFLEPGAVPRLARRIATDPGSPAVRVTGLKHRFAIA